MPQKETKHFQPPKPEEENSIDAPQILTKPAESSEPEVAESVDTPQKETKPIERPKPGDIEVSQTVTKPAELAEPVITLEENQPATVAENPVEIIEPPAEENVEVTEIDEILNEINDVVEAEEERNPVTADEGESVLPELQGSPDETANEIINDILNIPGANIIISNTDVVTQEIPSHLLPQIEERPNNFGGGLVDPNKGEGLAQINKILSRKRYYRVDAFRLPRKG